MINKLLHHKIEECVYNPNINEDNDTGLCVNQNHNANI